MCKPNRFGFSNTTNSGSFSRSKSLGRLHNAQLDEKAGHILDKFPRDHFAIDDPIERRKADDNMLSSCRNTHEVTSVIAYTSALFVAIIRCFTGPFPPTSNDILTAIVFRDRLLKGPLDIGEALTYRSDNGLRP